MALLDLERSLLAVALLVVTLFWRTCLSAMGITAVTLLIITLFVVTLSIVDSMWLPHSLRPKNTTIQKRLFAITAAWSYTSNDMSLIDKTLGIDQNDQRTFRTVHTPNMVIGTICSCFWRLLYAVHR